MDKDVLHFIESDLTEGVQVRISADFLWRIDRQAQRIATERSSFARWILYRALKRLPKKNEPVS